MSRKLKISVTLFTIVILIGIGGCLTLSHPPMDNTALDQYAEATQQTTSTSAEARDAGVERWKALLEEFSIENMEGKVSLVYADQFFFNDTLKTFREVEELEHYLLETAKMLQYGTVSYDDVVHSGENTYIRWKMVYRSKTLSPKQDIVTIGMSHLQFDEDGKVVLHQDFWDSTRGVFEHVPVLGAGIRAIKKRL